MPTPNYDAESYECDRADDDLNRIVRKKEELADWLYEARELYSQTDNHDLKDFDNCCVVIEQDFDMFFQREWSRLTKISGSIEWTTHIPSCETLRAKMAERRRQTRERLRAVLRPCVTNPASPGFGECVGENID